MSYDEFMAEMRRRRAGAIAGISFKHGFPREDVEEALQTWVMSVLRTEGYLRIDVDGVFALLRRGIFQKLQMNGARANRIKRKAPPLAVQLRDAGLSMTSFDHELSLDTRRRIEKLPERNRTLVRLVLEGRSRVEIADALNVTTVERVRQLLEETVKLIFGEDRRHPYDGRWDGWPKPTSLPLRKKAYRRVSTP